MEEPHPKLENTENLPASPEHQELVSKSLGTKGNLGRISVVNDLALKQQPVISCLAPRRRKITAQPDVRRDLTDKLWWIRPQQFAMLLPPAIRFLLCQKPLLAQEGMQNGISTHTPRLPKLPLEQELKPAITAVCAGAARAARAYLSQYLLVTARQEVRSDYQIRAICSGAL